MMDDALRRLGLDYIDLHQPAREKGATMEGIAQAYMWAKNPDMSILVGTTRASHLQDSTDAPAVDLTAEDVTRIEEVFPAELLAGAGMRNLIFRDGRMEM